MFYNANNLILEDKYQTPPKRIFMNMFRSRGPLKNDEETKNSLKDLADVIQKNDPDVLVLSEVGPRKVLDAFLDYSSLTQFKEIRMSNTTDRHRIACLSKEEELKLKRVTSYVEAANTDGQKKKRPNKNKIETTPEEATLKPYRRQTSPLKDLLEFDLKTKTGIDFKLFASHFKASPLETPQEKKEKDDAQRKAEANAAAAAIADRLRQDPNLMLMFMGDLNTENPQILNTLTCGGQLTEITDKTPTVTCGKNRGKFDYCFVSGNLKDKATAETVGAFNDPLYSSASDHLPIVVTVDLPDRAR